MQVNFYESVDDKLLKFAVIISKFEDKWVYCKHKERDTYEIPGGHREENEDIVFTAKRELYEETGALEFELEPICAYSVTGKNRVNETGDETYGMLFFADIKTFDKELHSEMEYIKFFDEMPEKLTYPLIQPLLMEEYLRRKNKAPKIITVCGSYKFKNEMIEITEKLTLAGNCVLTPIELTKSDKESYTDDEDFVIDKMHKEKIRLSDAIYVVNVGGYIGKSTKSEIEFAKSLNKEIMYLEV